MNLLVNKHGFTWHAGNRFVFSQTKTKDGWKSTGGHLWQSGQPNLDNLAVNPKPPMLNPNTGEHNGIWVDVAKSEFDPEKKITSKNWLKAGNWCDKLHNILLEKAGYE